MAHIKDENQSKQQQKEHETLNKNKLKKVVYTLKPALMLENWFGLSDFLLVNEDELVLLMQTEKFGVILSIFFIVMFAVFVDFPDTETESIMELMDEVPSMVVLSQYFIASITTSSCLSAIAIRIFETFADLDSMLLITTTQDFYNKSRYQTNKYLIILGVSHIISSTLDLLTDDEIVWCKFFVLPIYFLQKLEVLTFCKLIVMIQCRLQIINKYLTNFIEEQEKNKALVFTLAESNPKKTDKFNWIGCPSPNNMKIRDLATMYDVIGTICSLINDLFNIQIFMTLVSTFTYIVIAIWSTLYFYRAPNFTFGTLTTIIIWCITIILSVVVMSFVCERLVSVRNNTKILVNKVIMNYDLPKTMRVQAKAFMELIESWPLKIMVYDMFSVDISLMLKFISVATTYLIVIIQLSHFV
uniref:Gustatory receptor n=1 Tax=Bombyx mori TaxID=7091 RepID=B7FF42_BOMMO|nr:TPA_inf: gustatory receptor 53 [Bombyx mori]